MFAITNRVEVIAIVKISTLPIFKVLDMINRSFIYSALAAVIVFSGNTIAEDQQPVYGSPLITEQESLEHFEKMNNAKTASERQKLQQEHHQLLQKRSEARKLEQREMSKKQYESSPSDNKTGAGMGTGSSGGK